MLHEILNKPVQCFFNTGRRHPHLLFGTGIDDFVSSDFEQASANSHYP